LSKLNRADNTIIMDASVHILNCIVSYYYYYRKVGDGDFIVGYNIIVATVIEPSTSNESQDEENIRQLLK